MAQGVNFFQFFLVQFSDVRKFDFGTGVRSRDFPFVLESNFLQVQAIFAVLKCNFVQFSAIIVVLLPNCKIVDHFS